ncbi:helix-turn-helix transcriptional regulator [Streptomyces flaveolus]|uniref:helix-turn-helix domain-containing protein n=1 Tax=Streptomyces flaveolus TaxID=67297 RepID=UPI00343C6E45
MAGPLLLFQDLQGVVDEAVLGYRPSSGPAKTHPLSPQEWEIARLAASGLTDKQTAERMFLSHRTEGARLYQTAEAGHHLTRHAARRAGLPGHRQRRRFRHRGMTRRTPPGGRGDDPHAAESD